MIYNGIHALPIVNMEWQDEWTGCPRSDSHHLFTVATIWCDAMRVALASSVMRCELPWPATVRRIVSALAIVGAAQYLQVAHAYAVSEASLARSMTSLDLCRVEECLCTCPQGSDSTSSASDSDFGGADGPKPVWRGSAPLRSISRF